MKFKNIKKKVSSNKFPSNSRTIPDFANASSDKPAPLKLSFPKLNYVSLLKIYRRSLKVFVAAIFILAVIIVGLDLDANIRSKQSIDLEREKLTQELKFWEDFIAKHKDYRDAYLQASILEYRLGNSAKAKIYVEKGLSLDPNSEDGRKIEKVLNR